MSCASKHLLPLVAARHPRCRRRAGRPRAAPEDWYRFQALSDLQIAPDGSAHRLPGHELRQGVRPEPRALWSAQLGPTGEAVQLTRGESVTDPRFSPDGRYLSFLAARPATGATQLWLLDRRGGEARQVSHVERGDLRLRMVARRGARGAGHAQRRAEAGEGKAKAVKPVVIDDYQFKQDKEGYLTAASRTHLYLLDTPQRRERGTHPGSAARGPQPGVFPRRA